MNGRILVLGAAGRLGYAAAEAFRDAGWRVTSLVRPRAGPRAPRDTIVVETIDRAVAIEAARGMDVVLHALNPPYPEWHRRALPLAYSAIEAAETAGATLMFPGNLYNYGSDMPPLLDEGTPMRPTSHKGRIRVAIEQRIREASERGMRAIILRAGDFFGGGRGSWFDLVVMKDIGRRHITYPGPPDAVHEWAYVPDLAATMVRLAEIRDRLGVFETYGFPGHAVTGRELVAAIEKALGRPLEVKHLKWWLIHTVGRLLAMGRELSEIGYLWKVPHRIVGARLKAAIGDVPHTPLEEAVAQALKDLRLAA